jgi:hypothetical protein
MTKSLSLRWKADGDEWRLYRDNRTVGRVVPDTKYAGMWRWTLPDGGLSDMSMMTVATT